MYCPQCRSELPDDAKYCIKCGYDFTKIRTPASKKQGQDSLDGVGTSIQQESDIDSFEVGSLFANRYEILSEGHKGGMGAVYKVRDTKLNKIVALKIIHPRLVSSQQALSRFRQEVSISQELQHPNIVKVFNLEEWENKEYFTMEWVEGVTLREVIIKRKAENIPFRLNEAYKIISQLSDALNHAHKYTIHRDIKPENVLITDEKDFRVKLTDFGIAKMLSPSQFTSTSMQMGTPYYMAPEQKVDAGNVDKRADIYALGVVLYELLTLSNTIGLKLPSQIIKGIPKEIDDLLVRALEEKPEDRYADVKELSEALWKVVTAAAEQAEEQRKEIEQKRFEEEQKEREDAKKKKAQEELKRQEEEQLRKKAEEKKLKEQEEEKRKKEDEERKRLEAERLRVGEEKKKQEEKRIKEEQVRKEAEQADKRKSKEKQKGSNNKIKIGALVLAVVVIFAFFMSRRESNTPLPPTQGEQTPVPAPAPPPKKSKESPALVTIPAPPPAPKSEPISTPEKPKVVKTIPENERFTLSKLTVLDKETRLMWARDANIAARKMKWDDAYEFIEKINRSGYAGYRDWRLPDKTELLTLLDYAKSQRYTGNLQEPLVRIGFTYVLDWYWSSTTGPAWDGTDGAWAVNMGSGHVGAHSKADGNNAWPVRTGQ